MSIRDIIKNTKQKREKKARKKVLTGLAVGAVVGAAAGVLLAPKSGKETREDIASAAKQLPDKAKELAEAGKAKLQEVNQYLKEGKAVSEADLEAAAAEEPAKEE